MIKVTELSANSLDLVCDLILPPQNYLTANKLCKVISKYVTEDHERINNHKKYVLLPRIVCKPDERSEEMNQVIEVPTLNANAVIEQCSLSIMEAALVWELILTSRKTITITHVAKNCARDLMLKNILADRLSAIEKQAENLETVMKRAGFPSPYARPLDLEKMLFINDRMVEQEILGSLNQRICALAYIIRSSLTNRPLRLLAAVFMAEEMQQLQSLCVRSRQVKT